MEINSESEEKAYATNQKSNQEEKTIPTTATTTTSDLSKCSNEKIIKNKVHVTNLEWSVHENLLKKFLVKYGEIVKCKIIRDAQTNKSKGFGFVEFNHHSGASRLLRANKEDLILNGRQINVEYFKEIEKKKSRTRNIYHPEPHQSQYPHNQNLDYHFKTVSAANQNEQNNNLSELRSNKSVNVSELPYNVLISIFNHLCLRDLCIVEQVCKRWRQTAHMVWAAKQKLILDESNVFGNYKPPRTDNCFGFTQALKFDSSSLKQILNKKFGPNLKYMDLSYYAHSMASISFRIICEECPNLTHLNLSKMNLSNFNLCTIIKRCSKLKELIIACCSQISDSTISKVFKYCKDLEKLDITFCHLITGTCFVKQNNLKSLVLDQCENINDQYLIQLFNSNRNFIYLSMKRSKPFSSELLIQLVQNMNKLETLYLCETGFDCLSGSDIENLRFEMMKNLSLIDLSNSNGDNKLFGLIVKKCLNLKNLNISYCFKINDDMFSSSQINAPLVELNLSFLKNISDITLQSIGTYLTSTLKVFKVRGCSKITNEGICKTIEQLTQLNLLDIRSNYQLTNVVLEAALLTDFHNIEILCSDTSISSVEFKYKYPETEKHLIDKNLLQFKYKHLTFELCDSNPFKKFAYESKLMEDEGLIYFGSPINSEDEDLDGDFYTYFDDDEDYEDENLEEFLNRDENEMYKELD